MAYIQGEGRSQSTLFSVVLDNLVPADHICRVVDAFVEQLNMERLGFERGRSLLTRSGLAMTHVHCSSSIYMAIRVH